MGRCHIIISDFEAQFEFENQDESGCFLSYGHFGYHLNKLKDGRYISWGGYSCDEMCDYCDECFNWLEVSEEEAKAIIADPSKNHDD